MFDTKAHIKSATEHFGTFDMSCDHYTTSDLFKNAPIYINEMVPNSSISVDTSLMCRLMPLYKPMYSSCKFTLRAFFVPMRVIFPRFNEYITDTTTDQSSILGSVPKLSNNRICNAFRNELYSYLSTDSSYDFIYGGEKRYFTVAGRQMYSIMLSLGYGINFSNNDNTEMSALPLFAYAKIYQDWILTSQYKNTEINSKIKAYQNGGTLSGNDIVDIFKVVAKCYYSKDYFTQAWDRPVGPDFNSVSGLNYTPITFIDHTTHDYTDEHTSPTAISANENLWGTPAITKSSEDKPNNYISQFAIDALKSLTDYMRRHQLAGYRPLDRFLARWGTKLSSEKLYRSVYCGKYDCPIQIADIMATSDSEVGGNQTNLGDYAGRGIASFSNKNFSYKTDEFGYFIIVNEITSRTPIVQGRKKFVFHGCENRYQFYTPEFDNLATSVIRKDEILTGISQATAQTALPFPPDSIFGFQPQYSEYKTATGDFMSGNFRINSLSSGLDTYHTCRMFSEESIPTHQEAFISADYDTYQFNRIFQVSDVDHFINIFHFDVKMKAPMSDLYENYHFEEGGKEVSLNVNGTQLV